MKRTVPLLITAIAGFVLITSFFIPITQGWGEVAAVWFDILAAIAFILGGGNLLKMHLKKTSDRAPGWGYSVVTVVAFLAMLGAGLLKIGSPPATIQEYYGETFAELPLAELPESLIARVDGTIPAMEGGKPIPASARAQIGFDEAGRQVTFRGWMRKNQKQDLLDFKNELEWRCTVEKLFDASQPAEPLKGKVTYYADHRALSFRGAMTPEQRDALHALGTGAAWTEAVDAIYAQSQKITTVTAVTMPPEIELSESLSDAVAFDAAASTLSIKGPMHADQRDALVADFQWPLARPLDPAERAVLRSEIESRGEPLTPRQVTAFAKVLDGSWTPELIRIALDEAGKGQKEDKKACDMLAERVAGATLIEPKKPAGPDVSLNDEQFDLVGQFAGRPEMVVAQLSASLKSAGEFTDRQAEALKSFLSKQPTVGERGKALAIALVREGPLNQAQRDFLLHDYRRQVTWREAVGRLFIAAHTTKYPWSGAYRAQGNPFWWLYEYGFKPLTATMFAMLAFYVASAAFRAFRAKNFEAILLLGTAFIILLGRTFAGVYLTSWIDPDGPFSGLRLENITVTVMQVFNTAGNRAIMIGIALGIASTSLKVLLGVDRSYLGKE